LGVVGLSAAEQVSVERGDFVRFAWYDRCPGAHDTCRFELVFWAKALCGIMLESLAWLIRLNSEAILVSLTEFDISLIDNLAFIRCISGSTEATLLEIDASPIYSPISYREGILLPL